MTKDLSGKTNDVIETTLGDLIEAITQIALEAEVSREEGYRLASLTLSSILQRSGKNRQQFEALLSN